MSLTVKFLLNFSLLGTNIVLEADNIATGDLPEKLKDPLVFAGKTLGLNLRLTDILYELLQKIGLKIDNEIPGDFLPDIRLKDIYVSFANSTGEVNFIALTEFSGKEIQFIFQYTPASGEGDAKTESHYAFGIQTDLTSLAGLPMVGEQLGDVTITNVGFIYTSVKGDYLIPRLVDVDDELTGLPSKTIAAGDQKKNYEAGFNFIGELIYSKEQKPFTLTLPVDNKKADSNGMLTAPVKADTAPLKSAIKWINLDKKFGPLHISKIGFSYADSKISLLFTGELGISALVFSVEGLGLSFLPGKLIKGDNIKPEFKLSGLGLAVKKGPLKISGMFIKVEPSTGDIAYEFYGSAQITTSKFSIAGIGSFAKTTDGNISFFIYAVYMGPIGGPAFFFITGIAAGFGYNRKVLQPKIEEVKDFPLVAMALNPGKKDINEVLADLINKKVIPVSPGDYWLAVGIRFTSFKIIDAFILLIIQFGNKLEFTILGLAVLKFPGEGVTIAYVELAVMARFGEDSDVIAVDAIITPNSYIFNKDCVLSGGFAFYTWISGKHEGDFVITLGGYHPKFNKPAHYPSVNRLALNWKVNDATSIRGEMYFALTPTAIMAGGRWEIVYNISFLSASLTVWADMIIYWAPFHYNLDAGVQIRIEARIKIWFIRIYFKIEMTVELHIWGPPFAGEIYVDWSIFSFTIPFGSSSRELPPYLLWDKFSGSFIPKKKDQAEINPIDTRIINGIIKVYKFTNESGKEETISIVNPYELVICAESFIPTTTLKIKKDTITGDGTEIAADTMMEKADNILPGTYSDRSGKLGIKPMGMHTLSSTMTAWVERKGSSGNNIQPMAIVCNAKGVADALWGIDPVNYQGPVPETKVISNALTGLQFHTFDPLSTPQVILKNILDFSPIILKPTDTIGIPYLVNADALNQYPSNKELFKDIDKSKRTKTSLLESLSASGFDIYKQNDVIDSEMPEFFGLVYHASVDTKI
ncbi:MAG TPA: DUF6603 domain-containing protein [Chitinophagaceae bacterium]|nr:DUF6603 domain-containing protein [Chitinophagaceae bacterium]